MRRDPSNIDLDRLALKLMLIKEAQQTRKELIKQAIIKRALTGQISDRISDLLTVLGLKKEEPAPRSYTGLLMGGLGAGLGTALGYRLGGGAALRKALSLLAERIRVPRVTPAEIEELGTRLPGPRGSVLETLPSGWEPQIILRDVARDIRQAIEFNLMKMKPGWQQELLKRIQLFHPEAPATAPGRILTQRMELAEQSYDKFQKLIDRIFKQFKLSDNDMQTLNELRDIIESRKILMDRAVMPFRWMYVPALQRVSEGAPIGEVEAVMREGAGALGHILDTTFRPLGLLRGNVVDLRKLRISPEHLELLERRLRFLPESMRRKLLLSLQDYLTHTEMAGRQIPLTYQLLTGKELRVL